MRLSAIVPALEEGTGIEETLRSLAGVRRGGGEIIVVDGGSTDDTAERAEPLCDRVIESGAGRARQMNAGAAAARGDWLWFVHADTAVDADAVDELYALASTRDRRWARFGVRLSGDRPLFRVIAWLMNARSCLTGIATGDQALAVERTTFAAVGGFPEQPLMEDIVLSRALRAQSRPACLPVRVTTSSRRWEEEGVWRTIRLMWALRFAYWRGTDPAVLARRYRGEDAA